MTVLGNLIRGRNVTRGVILRGLTVLEQTRPVRRAARYFFTWPADSPRASIDEGIRPAIPDCWADSFVKALFLGCLYTAISGLHAAIPGCLRSVGAGLGTRSTHSKYSQLSREY